MFWMVQNESEDETVTEFRNVKWFTTSCVLSWATRGIYGIPEASEGQNDQDDVRSSEVVKNDYEPLRMSLREALMLTVHLD
eukprot:jgi/Hompol1/3777/HPOL_006739-RA